MTKNMFIQSDNEKLMISFNLNNNNINKEVFSILVNGGTIQ